MILFQKLLMSSKILKVLSIKYPLKVLEGLLIHLDLRRLQRQLQNSWNSTTGLRLYHDLSYKVPIKLCSDYQVPWRTPTQLVVFDVECILLKLFCWQCQHQSEHFNPWTTNLAPIWQHMTNTACQHFLHPNYHKKDQYRVLYRAIH